MSTNSNDQFTRYVITLTPNPGVPRDEAVVKKHVAFLRELDRKGQFVLGGPFEDGGGGMIIIKAESLEAARATAQSDPFVTSGSRTCEVRAWLLSCEENNHQGMG